MKKRLLALILILSVLLVQVVMPVSTAGATQQKQMPFTDVTTEHWYYYTVRDVYQAGLMSGLAGTTLFAPEEAMTRAMVATVLHRMEHYPKATGTGSFKDLNTSAYYFQAVKWAAGKGIVNGYKADNTFKPDKHVTREEIVTMLCNYAKYLGKYKKASTDLTKYADYQDVSDYAEPAMKWAVKNGLISGKNNGTRLDPKGKATRAECAKMLLQTQKLVTRVEGSGGIGTDEDGWVQKWY